MVNQLIASFVVGAIAFWGAFQLYPRIFPPQSVEAAGLPLDETIRSIKRELIEIAATPGETAGLVLRNVKVELMAQRESQEGANAELAIPVFKEAAITAETTTKLSRGSKITVVFDAPSGEQLLAEGKRGDLNLSGLVLAARRALLSTESDGPELAPESVDIEVSFVLVQGREDGAQVTAHVLAVGKSSAQMETAGNKVVLSYINPLLVDAEEKRSVSARPIPPK